MSFSTYEETDASIKTWEKMKLFPIISHEYTVQVLYNFTQIIQS